MGELINRADQLIEQANQSFEDGDQGSAILQLAASKEKRQAQFVALSELTDAASWLAYCAETSGGTAGPDDALCKAVERVSGSLRHAREALS